MSELSKHRQALFCGDKAAQQAYKDAMKQACDAILAWLDDDQMYTGGQIKTLRKQISFCPSKDGLGLTQGVARIADIFLNNSLKVHHVNSLAHLHCPTLISSQIAEMFINAANQSMDSWDQSPAGSLMEVLLIEWLNQKVGYDKGDGVFTSGGTQSNLMGMLLARDACIAQHYQDDANKPWSVQQLGLPSEAIGQVKVLCSQNAHFSVQKNMAMMGMGFASVVPIAVNDKAQMDSQALQRTVDELITNGNKIACIFATAGTTDAGAIDPIAKICDIAKTVGAWVHVDAAWGGALLLSGRYRHRLQELHLADSVTLDFHKQYFQTISCGAFLLKDKANYRHIHYEAEYLNSAYDEAHGVPNLVSKSLQTTRRFDALKLWLTIEAMGETGYGDMIDHGIELTCHVADHIKQTDGLELLIEPQFASVLFRVAPTHVDKALLDSLNQNVADELFAKGLANIGVTKVGEVQSLKLTMLSPIATLDDVKALLAMVLTTADEIGQSIAQGSYTPPID